MNTPTPRTDAIYLQRGNWANEEDLRDLARRLETELAAERARLDWLLLDVVSRFDDAYYTRATIDEAMKEGAK